MANERLRALEDVEKEIATTLQCAGEDRQCIPIHTYSLVFLHNVDLLLTYIVIVHR